MGEWRLLARETDFKNALRDLKRISKGSFVTNYQPLSSNIEEELKYTEFYFSNDNNNLFLIERCDGFYKLIYACVLNERGLQLDPPSSVNNSFLVVDIVEIEGFEKQNRLLDELVNLGFDKYKTFHLWVCDGSNYSIDVKPAMHPIFKEDKAWFLDIYDYFDKYSDCLPLRQMFNSFQNNSEGLSYSIDGSYVGGVVYHIKGKTVTEDYIFVKKEFRGVGRLMQSMFLDECFKNYGSIKVYAWIEDNNAASIRIHEANGYVKTNQYKTTLRRDGKVANM